MIQEIRCCKHLNKYVRKVLRILLFFPKRLSHYRCNGCSISIRNISTFRTFSLQQTSLNLSHIQLICCRRLSKQKGKNTENLSKWNYNDWKKLKTKWQKEKLLVLSNFSFCHNVFKSCRLQRRQKRSICGNELKHEGN